ELADVIICSDLLGMTANISYGGSACWPSLSPQSEQHDYSSYGAKLGALAGRACAMTLSSEKNNILLEENMRILVFTTKMVANRLEIDLEREVISKFNATSTKLEFDVYL